MRINTYDYKSLHNVKPHFHNRIFKGAGRMPAPAGEFVVCYFHDTSQERKINVISIGENCYLVS
jgi:hypothetical protein